MNFLHGYKESASHHHENGNDFYRAQYFAAINNKETIKNRFDQPDYQTYINIEQTLLKGALGLDVDQHIRMLQTIYKNEFDYIQLKPQLPTLFFSLYFKLQSNMPLTMKGLIKHIQGLNPGKKALLSQVFQLTQYCLVMPASNTESERSFRVLRRIKTYLRNTMAQNWLNHTICLNIHTERLIQINLKEILNEFVDSSDRRKAKSQLKFFCLGQKKSFEAAFIGLRL